MERQPDVEVTVVQHCHLLADVRKYTCDLVNRVRGWSLQPCVVFPDMRFLEIVYRLICSLSNVKSNIFTVHHWNLLKGTIIPHLTITSCNIYLPLSWPNPQAGSPCVSLGKYGLPWLLLTADYVYLCLLMFLGYLFHSDLIAVCNNKVLLTLTKYSPVGCQVESLWWFHPSPPWTRSPCGPSEHGWTHVAMESHSWHQRRWPRTNPHWLLQPLSNDESLFSDRTLCTEACVLVKKTH